MPKYGKAGLKLLPLVIMYSISLVMILPVYIYLTLPIVLMLLILSKFSIKLVILMNKIILLDGTKDLLELKSQIVLVLMLMNIIIWKSIINRDLVLKISIWQFKFLCKLQVILLWLKLKESKLILIKTLNKFILKFMVELEESST
jgi:hypothetical protein